MANRYALTLTMLSLLNVSVMAEVKMVDQVVAPISQAARYFITPQDAHLLAIVPSGNQFVVKYDGKDGPVVDEVLNLGGLKYTEFDKAMIGVTDSPQKYFAFSDDGQHYAYAARAGKEIVVMVDDKEVGRHALETTTVRGLNFIPNRNSVYYNIKNNRSGRFDFQIIIDGKPGPATASEPQVKFSRDGSRHAYVAMRVEDYKKRYLIIDGAEAPYAGESPVFTGDGKKLVTLGQADGKMSVQVDGKELVSSANITQIFTAPVGDRVAVIFNKPEVRANVLFLDGAEVAGTQGAEDIIFSPDGKRYAALCRTPQATRFYVLDGKPQKPFTGMTDAQFNLDSSKFVYVGIDATAKQSVVINETESPAYFSLAMKPKFSNDGKRLAWIGVPQPGQNVLVVDDSQFEPVKSLLRFSFSPDGSKFAFLDNLPSIGKSMVTIDTAPQSDVIYSGDLQPVGYDDPMTASPVLFSADGKHFAFTGALASNPNVQGMMVDGQFMTIASPPVSRGAFTPDGKHLFWTTSQSNKSTIYLDGKVVGGWDHNPVVYNAFDRAKENWKIDADGVLSYLAPAGNEIKRFRITPDPETSLATMEADMKSAQANAEADAKAALAAQQQKEKDAQAAKLKAAEEAKAAAAQTTADKKKAFDEALAAKQKAREEAAAAKAKARQEALDKTKGK